MKNAPLRRIASCLALGSSLLLVACDTGADPVTERPSGTSSSGGGSSNGGTTGGATIDWNARPARRRESVASSSERSPTRRNREEVYSVVLPSKCSSPAAASALVTCTVRSRCSGGP